MTTSPVSPEPAASVPSPHGALTMTAFDLNTHPLTPGVHSLEASAGTGKTFSLVGLMLRFVVEEGRRLPEILAVTFTQKATGELAERLRRKLAAALVSLENNDTPVADPQLRHWRDEVAAAPELRALRISRLRTALAESDNASIFTIHGFCQRVLSECAFESGLAFDLDMEDAGEGFTRTAVRDFLRELYRPLTDPRSPHAGAARFIHDEIGADEKKLTELAKHLASGYRIRWASYVTESKTAAVIESLAAFSKNRDRLLAEAESDPSLNRLYSSIDALREDLARTLGIKGSKGAVASAEKSLADFVALTFAATVEKKLAAVKEAAGALTFDDLIKKTAEALAHPETGDTLAARIRERFKVGLIDEFQDTDRLQTVIFQKIFTGAPLFLIGDPKQSIYRFRGADLGAFTAATGAAGVIRAPLDTNHRSAPDMVAAANALFAEDTRSGKKSLFPETGFVPVKAGATSVPALSDADGRPAVALTLVWTQGPGESGVVSKSRATSRIVRDLAARIAGILRDHRLGDRPVSASDIAVLVRTGDQGARVQDALRAVGVPASRVSGSVFDSEAATAFRRLLVALIAPRRTKTLKAALAGPIIGMNAGDIRESDTDEAIGRDWADLFADAAEVWKNAGIAAAVTGILRRKSLPEKMLRRADGERLLADLRHLLEFAHAEERAGRLAPEALLARFDTRIRDAAGPTAPDADRRRLESDRPGVVILTMHAAKGLEFPVVFVPFAWNFGGHAGFAAPKFVTGTLDGGRVVAPAGNHADLKAREVVEQREEQARLLYVAVTRAKSACFLYSGLIVTKDQYGNWRNGIWETSLGTLGPVSDFSPKPGGEPVKVTLRCDWENFAQSHSGYIRLSDCGVPRTTIVASPETAPVAGAPVARTFKKKPDVRKISASYSGITRHLGHDDAPAPAADVSHRHDETLPGGPDSAPAVPEKPADSIHTFPRGATVGEAVHGFLEEHDFTRPAPLAAVKDALRTNGIDRDRWGEILRERIDAWLASPLTDDDDATFALRDIAPEDRLAEMNFDLRAGFDSVTAIADALATSADAARLAPTITALRAAKVPKLDGYMTGFIDLVFRRDGRYHILDWKTNRLGPDFAAYAPGALNDAMSGHRYHLQYHVYLVALDAHLRACLPDYDPARHLGAVYYLFVRGLDPSLPGNGVFRAAAEPDVVSRLARALGATTR